MPSAICSATWPRCSVRSASGFPAERCRWSPRSARTPGTAPSPAPARPGCIRSGGVPGPPPRPPATPGDLLFHIRSNRMDLSFEYTTQVMARLSGAVRVIDEEHGFRYFDERDLIGFVDGTESPSGSAGVKAGLVDPADDPDFAGGSYVIIQKYLHDLPAWNAISVEEQELVIGRTKLDDIEMPDDVKPVNSHVALNTVTGPDGEEIKIVRANMPFGHASTGEFGTYYIAYAATPDIIELMLVNMFIGRPPGNTDRILAFPTAVTGPLFSAPPAEFLEDPPDAPAAAGETGAD